METPKPTYEELELRCQWADKMLGGIVAQQGDNLSDDSNALLKRLIRIEQRAVHAQKVLPAIRQVHHLIAEESDPQLLIERACIILAQAPGGYVGAWIALTEENGETITLSALAGHENQLGRMRHRLEHGERPRGMRDALETTKVIVCDRPREECPDCPLVLGETLHSVLHYRLVCEGKVYGVLSVIVDARFAHDGEEQSLLQEVADDLAFALRKIEDAWTLNQQMAERQKRLETQERRISQLTQPHGDLSSLRFEDLFDVDEIQKIQDAFSASTGVASIITDPQGKPITKPSNFCRFCMDIIRGTPQGLANCMQSDAVLGRMGPGGYAMQPCLSGGLWDGGTPIAVGDHHIGNWLIGQVLDSSLDIERMVEYAVSLGADEAESRKAVADIPRMSVVQFGKVCQALYLIAQQLSKFAMQNLLQARYMTEQARAEEERYRCLFETMTQGVVYQAEDGTIVSANPAAERIFGLSEKEIIGKTALIGDWGAVREDGSEFIADDYPMMVALRTGQPVHDVVMGIYNAKNDTETWIVVNAIPLFRPGEKIPYQVYATLDDITERKAVEKEREEMQVQRLHSQKMESVGQLAAGIAHEINTPTQFIGDNTRFLQDAFSDLMELLEKYEVVRTEAKQGAVSSDLMEELDGLIEKNDLAYLKEEIPPAIERSLVGIERVTKIVRAMKEFSHPGGNEYTLFDINRAIESTVTVAENEWKYVAELETDFDPSLPMVSCLPGPFNQVILNMIVNAAHAITEKISAGEKGRGRIWISTRRKDQEVEIRIADTGMGIPENIQDRIFDPFFTTKEVGKGTGQGLAIAYSVIVEQHHGTIQVESKVGVGTTFILRIPV